MDYFGSIYHKSESDVLEMQFIVEGIKKIVVLVLLMELVMQIQPGKEYEPYIKMLVGIMVVYSIFSGIFNVFGKFSEIQIAPMKEFVWSGEWSIEEETVLEEKKEIRIEKIIIEEIKQNEIKTIGGMP